MDRPTTHLHLPRIDPVEYCSRLQSVQRGLRMGRLAAWLPLLMERLDVGLKQSQFVKGLKEPKGLELARAFCLDLWPFIRELPENIAAVRDVLPENMSAANRLLSELADEEYVYQSLFVKQCLLAGLTLNDLEHPQIGPAAGELSRLMREKCQSGDYCEGLLAIVTAELAATAFARRTTPFFEEYFRKHSSSYSPLQLDEGLEWLRLHAKPQTRNALLLNRAIAALDQTGNKYFPPTVQVVLESILTLWRCPALGVVETEPAARVETSGLARA